MVRYRQMAWTNSGLAVLFRGPPGRMGRLPGGGDLLAGGRVSKHFFAVVFFRSTTTNYPCRDGSWQATWPLDKCRTEIPKQFSCFPFLFERLIYLVLCMCVSYLHICGNTYVPGACGCQKRVPCPPGTGVRDVWEPSCWRWEWTPSVSNA